MLNENQAWQVLNTVPDPEVPVISVVELGIVRGITCTAEAITVVVTPTYSGCPATEVISQSIQDSLIAAGAKTVRLETRLSPAWTSDWIDEPAREKLRAYGIVPPDGKASVCSVTQPVRFIPRTLACPRCHSHHTERLSEFGSTACKATYRCKTCLEPFEYFKPI